MSVSLDPDNFAAIRILFSVRVFYARNSQRDGRSLPRQGRDHLSQWDVGVSVGFFAENTGSLLIPRPGVPHHIQEEKLEIFLNE